MDILLPPAGKGPGVLVCHAWWGLNQTVREYGFEIARAGFVVGFPDVFNSDVTDSIKTAETLIRKHWDKAAPTLAAAFAELRAHPAVTPSGLGAIGFSFGGFHLLEELGRAGSPLTHLVTYYATYPLPDRHAPVLAHFAAEDDYESATDMSALATALTKAGPPNASYSYPGTQHWFAEPDRPEYDEKAAALAFDRTVAFLRQTLV